MAAYLTTRELAERFRAPEATVRWWRHRGYGPPAIKVGRRRLYPLADVEAWEARLRAEAQRERDPAAA